LSKPDQIIDNVDKLLQSIALEQLDDNLFRGGSHNMGSPRVYGGQALSQALDAAIQTIPKDRFIHSLHSLPEELLLFKMAKQSLFWLLLFN